MFMRCSITSPPCSGRNHSDRGRWGIPGVSVLNVVFDWRRLGLPLCQTRSLLIAQAACGSLESSSQGILIPVQLGPLVAATVSAHERQHLLDKPLAGRLAHALKFSQHICRHAIFVLCAPAGSQVFLPGSLVLWVHTSQRKPAQSENICLHLRSSWWHGELSCTSSPRLSALSCPSGLSNAPAGCGRRVDGKPGCDAG